AAADESPALVRLHFANDGNADAYITIEDVQANGPSGPISCSFSFYSQDMVPAKGFCIHDLVVRNLPNDFPDTNGSVRIVFAWGGANREETRVDENIQVRFFSSARASAVGTGSAGGGRP